MREIAIAMCLAVSACDDSGRKVSDDGGAGGIVDAVASDGGQAANRSAGCGQATTLTAAMFVARDIQSGGVTRQEFVRLPTGYDSQRAYPVIYELHGCSSDPQRENNNVPVENQSGTDAIVVRGRAATNCWDTSANGADAPYFDAMLADVEAQFCVDTSRRFVTGYSSGSFMAAVMGCTRGDKIRGVATIAGGQAGQNCTGNPAALLIHDANDNTVNISASVGTRDRYLVRNACAMPASSTATDHAPCVTYTGCATDQPVFWCPTAGQDHSRQDALAAPIFWDFISDLL